MSAAYDPRNELKALFAWALADSAARQRADRANELARKIRTVACGDCDKWMKSRECPRERNVNGWNKGPSMVDPICSVFVEKESSKAQRKLWAEEGAALLKEHLSQK